MILWTLINVVVGKRANGNDKKYDDELVRRRRRNYGVPLYHTIPYTRVLLLDTRERSAVAIVTVMT